MSLKEGKRGKRKRSPAPPPVTFSLEVQKQLDKAWEKSGKKKGELQVRKAMKLMKEFLGVDVEKSEFRQQETLDQSAFFSMAGKKIEQKAKALKAFELFDEHKKGLVVLEDLQRVAADLEEAITVEELEEMIQEVDQAGDGLLTSDDFIRIAKKVRL